MCCKMKILDDVETDEENIKIALRKTGFNEIGICTVDVKDNKFIKCIYLQSKYELDTFIKHLKEFFEKD